MSDSAFHELFPLGEDDTPYRKLGGDHVALAAFDGQRVVRVAPEALTMRDGRQLSAASSHEGLGHEAEGVATTGRSAPGATDKR